MGCGVRSGAAGEEEGFSRVSRGGHRAPLLAILGAAAEGQRASYSTCVQVAILHCLTCIVIVRMRRQ